MRNPGLEQATRVAVRSYASAVAIDARAGDSVPSPPSGDALGESDLPQPGLDGARAHPMDDIDTARAQEYALLSPQALIASCSSTISLHGWGASSPTSNAPKPPISIAT